MPSLLTSSRNGSVPPGSSEGPGTCLEAILDAEEAVNNEDEFEVEEAIDADEAVAFATALKFAKRAAAVDDNMYNTMYTWEGGCDRSWDKILDGNDALGSAPDAYFDRDPDSGSSSTIPDPLHQQHRKGTFRSSVILLDASDSMKETDYKPNRLECTISILAEFLKLFFQLNPLSSIGIVAMFYGQSSIIRQLSSSPKAQIEALTELRSHDVAGGSISLLNGLEKCLALVSSVPQYSIKEILIISGSIKSCDAGNIENVINLLRQRSVQTSVVSFAPEVYVLNRIVKSGNGTYRVARDRDEFRAAIMSQLVASNWVSCPEARLVPMGFPTKVASKMINLCICHGRPSFDGYICPRCSCKVCEIPTRCRACQLELVNPESLARTSQHLNPRVLSTPLPRGQHQCRFCCRIFFSGGAICPKCQTKFCYACDKFRLKALRNCPTCLQHAELRTRKQLLNKIKPDSDKIET